MARTVFLGARQRVSETAYFDLIGKPSLSAEQRLLLAILVDALRILHASRDTASRSKREIFAETEQWVFRPGNGSPFSFDWVCEALGIDADHLRPRLAKLRSGSKPFRLQLKQWGSA